MQVNYHLKMYYHTACEVKLPGRLNDAVWFHYEVESNYLTLCHDTDEDIIKFVETLQGDADAANIQVHVDGYLTEAEIRVEESSWTDSKSVYLVIPMSLRDDAMYNEAYEVDYEVELVK